MNSVVLVALANHLWQSTLVAVVTGGLTLIVRGNGARVRYLLWLAASVKFLIPFAVLMAVGAWIPWPLHPVHGMYIASTAGQMAAQMTPFGREMATGLVSHTGNSGGAVLIALGALWLAGTLAVAARALTRWIRIDRARRESTRGSLAFVIPVRTSFRQLEPAVVGILRPVLLLPEGIEQRLTAQEMRAVLAHERCHVAWRDNLAAALHMVVEALFWFYPLVWWLGARLVAERERACDEQVLADGHAPDSYAEGILKVCEHYLESRLPCVAGVSGADLTQRIEAIMKNRLIARLNGVRKLVLAVTATATVAAPVAVGVLTSSHARAQGEAPDTEDPSVSIQLGTGDVQKTPKVAPAPNRWHLNIRLPLRGLIAQAYSVSESQVVGMDWSKDQIYHITADGSEASLSRGYPAMMRDLLTRHFGLVVKTEPKQMDGYVLLIGPGGSKLEPNNGGSASGKVSQFLSNGVDVYSAAVGTLVDFLQRTLNVPVVDETGIQGNYDFKVTWESSSPGAPADPAAVAKALEEQLGLNLEAESVTVDVINVVSIAAAPSTASVTSDPQLPRVSPPLDDSGFIKSGFINCVRLSGHQEVPPVETDAWGDAVIRVHRDRTITGTIATHGIQGTMAYIRQGWEGTNGPTILTLQRGPGDTWVVPADSKFTQQQYASFLQAKLYVIVDSVAHPDGEIRAKLIPVKVCERNPDA